MSAKPDCSQNWAFGAFELEGRTAELRRNGVAIRLQEQPSQLLLFLLQHAGQIVTRDDLRLQLWPADTFVDFDHALNTAVMKLREALGSSIPAFLMSGDTGPERLREAQESGHHLLHKPVRPMRLRAMVSQMLKNPEVAGAA